MDYIACIILTCDIIIIFDIILNCVNLFHIVDNIIDEILIYCVIVCEQLCNKIIRLPDLIIHMKF